MTFLGRSVAAILLSLLASAGAEARKPSAGMLTKPGIIDASPSERQAESVERPIQLELPNMTSEGDVRGFETLASRTCQRQFSVNRLKIRSSRPEGTVLLQFPPAKTSIGCGRLVFVSEATPAPPSSWEMPDMTLPDAVANLRTDALRRRGCELFFIDETTQRDTRPAGAFVGQYPPVGTPLTCDVRPRVARSLGPPPAPRFTVPDLSDPTVLLNFESNVASACRDLFKVGRNNSRSAGPKGAFLTQSPAAGTSIGCGAKVSTDYSSGPAPRFIVPDLSDPTVWHGFESSVTRGCGKTFKVGGTAPKGTFLSQSPPAGTSIGCGDRVSAVHATAFRRVGKDGEQVGPVPPPPLRRLTAMAGSELSSSRCSPPGRAQRPGSCGMRSFIRASCPTSSGFTRRRATDGRAAPSGRSPSFRGSLPMPRRSRRCRSSRWRLPMSDRPIPISTLLADSRDAVDEIVARGRSADGAGIGLERAVHASAGAVDDAVRAACNIDLVDLLVEGWSKAHELGEYADPEQYPVEKTVRMVLAHHPVALTIDPQLRLQALPLIDWPLKLLIVLEAIVDAATLVIRGGRIVGVDLGTIELSAKVRWDEATVPLPLRKHKLTLPGKFELHPGVAIPRRTKR